MTKTCLVSSLLALLFTCGVALAGSPHFVSCAVSVTDQTVCVVGKEAGLGSELQVEITLVGSAHCQNHGGNQPSAQNKVDFTQDATEPVQNGRALYEVCATADFQPDCTRSMDVVVDSVVLFDDTHGISCTLTQ